MQSEPQIVTAGLGDVVPALFIVIAIVSGIRNFLKERANAQQVQQMRKRKRQGRELEQNDELSQFLNEVGTSGKQSKPQKRKRPTQRQHAEERRRRRTARGQRQRPKSQGRKSRRQSQPESSSISDRHLETDDLGSVREHHLESTVKDRHLESDVADRHLFDDIDQQQQSSGRQQSPHPIAKLLSEPTGVRNAILLNEILQPPLSRRKQ